MGRTLAGTDVGPDLLTAPAAAARHGVSRTLAWQRAHDALDTDPAVQRIGHALVAPADWWASALAPRGKGGRPRKYPRPFVPPPEAPVGNPFSVGGTWIPGQRPDRDPQKGR